MPREPHASFPELRTTNVVCVARGEFVFDDPNDAAEYPHSGHSEILGQREPQLIDIAAVLIRSPEMIRRRIERTTVAVAHHGFRARDIACLIGKTLVPHPAAQPRPPS